VFQIDACEGIYFGYPTYLIREENILYEMKHNMLSLPFPSNDPAPDSSTLCGTE